jgi:hypothetical protein
MTNQYRSTEDDVSPLGHLPFSTLARISSLVFLWLLCGCAGPHEVNPHIVGRVSGNTYTSPGGHFSVPFPVVSDPELGGRIIRDDAQSVTFHDKRGTLISFYSRPIGAKSPMMSVLQTNGPEKALGILAKDIYGEAIVPHYHPDVRDGTISFIYLKLVGPTKTGVAAFIHQKRVYFVETDLLPGVQVLSSSDPATQDSLDEWLENHAVELLGTMEIK